MSSQDKQKKKARRAADKAKANRVKRADRSAPADPFDNRNDNPFDAEGDLTPESLLEMGVASGDFIEIFEQLKKAHAKSQKELCIEFLDSDLLQNVIGIWEEEDLTDFIFGFLVAYKEWFDGSDEDKAVAWIESEGFGRDYQAASLELEKRHQRR